jgi:hypothetical protein
MDIAEALAAQEAVKHGSKRCNVGRILDDLRDDPNHEALVELVEDEKHARTLLDLQAVFIRLEHDVSASAVGIHRRRKCRCYL